MLPLVLKVLKYGASAYTDYYVTIYRERSTLCRLQSHKRKLKICRTWKMHMKKIEPREASVSGSLSLSLLCSRAHLHVVGMLGFMSSLLTPFYSVLVSVSVFMAFSTLFHSINSPDNSLVSHPVLPALFLLYSSVQLYISL